MNYLYASAEISRCRVYRYRLVREWDRSRDTIVFCMLNPSTADGTKDDQTIRKCVGFAKSWGYGRLTVVNLFAFRATKPSDMRAARDPIGPANDEWIIREATDRIVVCAWGAGFAIGRVPFAVITRPCVVRDLIRQAGRPRHLGLTQHGHPKHPLLLRGDTMLQTFPEAK
jgi:hypothetical protein